MRILELAGTHYEMGRQHGRQVRDLRPLLLRAIEERLGKLRQAGAETRPWAEELLAAWKEIAPTTLEMLKGIAEALRLDWEPFCQYTVASYLEDRSTGAAQAEGCTVWAAAGAVTHDGAPILAKNRDYRLAHLPLQCLARARPAAGYPYVYVTSAGSPAVFSSGMNEAGLAVADTHVTSLDIGPGLARYSIEMELLEHHDTVQSALDYLRNVPHLGDGTLVLADTTGDLAVFETGHTHCGVVRSKDDFVVSTNHFVTKRLRDLWVDSNPPQLRGNSQGRHARVTTALQVTRGRVNAGWAQELMTTHGGPQEAICRHPERQPRSGTISTVIFSPAEGILYFANGQPCQADFRRLSTGLDLQ